MIYILAIIIVLGVLVFVHELGHFIAAKIFGVRVETFSIGFPPRLFGVKIGETDYCVSAIPLGGYVKLSGMIDESLDTSKLKGEPYEFMSKPLYQKIIIISAGVIMNFALAVGILGGAIWLQGEPIIPTTTVGVVAEEGIGDVIGLQKHDKIIEVNDTRVYNWQEIEQAFIKNLGSDIHFVIKRNGTEKVLHLSWEEMKEKSVDRLNIGPLYAARVGELTSDYPAAEAGLQRGDRIVAINGQEVTNWEEMANIISGNPGTPLSFAIKRDSRIFTVDIAPRAETVETEDEQKTVGRIGITPYFERHEVSLGVAIVKGFNQAVLFGKLNVKGFGRIISGRDSAQDMLAGPIEIARIAGDTAKQSFSNLVMLIAYLSVILAIINILPIPALDGGHLVIILIEGIRQKPLSVRVKMIVQQIGMVFLLLLIFFVIYNDLARIFN